MCVLYGICQYNLHSKAAWHVGFIIVCTLSVYVPHLCSHLGSREADTQPCELIARRGAHRSAMSVLLQPTTAHIPITTATPTKNGTAIPCHICKKKSSSWSAIVSHYQNEHKIPSESLADTYIAKQAALQRVMQYEKHGHGLTDRLNGL